MTGLMMRTSTKETLEKREGSQNMKWRDATKELPKVKVKVLTSNVNGTMRVNHLTTDYGVLEWDTDNDRITHWTPLPKPAI